MKSERVKFKNISGHELSGRIDLPFVGRPKAYVLFAHCFTCSKNLKAVDNICAALTRNNMAVLRFDFTGLGQSGGEFEETNFSSNLMDLKSACHFLAEHYEAPQIMIGHSLGGAAVLHASKDLEHVKAVVTVGAPASPIHVKRLIKDEAELKEKGEVEVSIGGRPFMLQRQFLEDLEKNDSHQVIKDLKKALLIMHAPQDQVVGIENAAEIYDHAMHPKSFVSLDGMDHLLSEESFSQYVGDLICPWSSRYIEAQSNEIAPEGEVWTRLSGSDFITEVTAGEHHMLADEPEGVGGSNLGPSPYDYLLSALGACTAMTLRMYASHKKIDLKSVKVKLTHNKVHNEDTQNAEGSNKRIDRIMRYIELDGDLTRQQRERLIEIAEKCPVHKTIEGKPQILTEEWRQVK